MDLKDFKLPLYNLLNMLLIGVVFVAACVCMFPKDFASVVGYIKTLYFNESVATLIFIFVAYEIGLIINRIGSMIESLLKRDIAFFLKIPWRDYSQYVKAEINDSFIRTLNREYGLSRSNLAMFLILTLISYFVENFILGTVFLGLAFLFYFSIRKHAGKIVARIDLSNEKPS